MIDKKGGLNLQSIRQLHDLPWEMKIEGNLPDDIAVEMHEGLGALDARLKWYRADILKRSSDAVLEQVSGSVESGFANAKARRAAGLWNADTRGYYCDKRIHKSPLFFSHFIELGTRHNLWEAYKDADIAILDLCLTKQLPSMFIRIICDYLETRITGQKTALSILSKLTERKCQPDCERIFLKYFEKRPDLYEPKKRQPHTIQTTGRVNTSLEKFDEVVAKIREKLVKKQVQPDAELEFVYEVFFISDAPAVEDEQTPPEDEEMPDDN